MAPETATRQTLEESFKSAVAQHSESESVETDSEKVTSSEEVSETESAEAQSSEEKEEAASSEEETAEETLLTDEDIEAFEATDDLDEKRKILNRAYTQKTQALAEKRKELESWSQVIEAYNSDPEATVRSIAEHLGLKIGEPTAEEKVEQVAAQVGSNLVERMRTALGPELEFLADRLAPVMTEATREIAQEVVSSAVAPLQKQQEAQLTQTAAAEVQTALSQFRQKHDDWKEAEAKMTELMGRYRPSKGVQLLDYLEDIYAIASREKVIAKTTKQVVDRLKKSAKSASSNEGVSDKKVHSKPPARPNLREAFEAAKRGERWS